MGAGEGSSGEVEFEMEELELPSPMEIDPATIAPTPTHTSPADMPLSLVPSPTAGQASRDFVQQHQHQHTHRGRAQGRSRSGSGVGTANEDDAARERERRAASSVQEQLQPWLRNSQQFYNDGTYDQHTHTQTHIPSSLSLSLSCSLYLCVCVHLLLSVVDGEGLGALLSSVLDAASQLETEARKGAGRDGMAAAAERLGGPGVSRAVRAYACCFFKHLGITGTDHTQMCVCVVVLAFSDGWMDGCMFRAGHPCGGEVPCGGTPAAAAAAERIKRQHRHRPAKRRPRQPPTYGAGHPQGPRMHCNVAAHTHAMRPLCVSVRVCAELCPPCVCVDIKPSHAAVGGE